MSSPTASDIDAMTARGWTWSAERGYFHAFGARDRQDCPILNLRVEDWDDGDWVACYGVPGIGYEGINHHPSPLLAADEAEAWLRRVLEPFRFGWLKVGAAVPTCKDVTPTIFECRCCANAVRGFTDGSVTASGWRDIDHIDGPNAICPECIADPEALDGLREEYPEAVMGAARVVRA